MDKIISSKLMYAKKEDGGTAPVAKPWQDRGILDIYQPGKGGRITEIEAIPESRALLSVSEPQKHADHMKSVSLF